MNWRATKDKARRVVQDTFKVAAFYRGPAEDSPLVPCNVRILNSFKALGDMAGTSYDYAEISQKTPEIIFWRDEIEPEYLGLVIVSETEGYSLGMILPPDGLTQTANVAPIEPAEAAFYFAMRE